MNYNKLNVFLYYIFGGFEYIDDVYITTIQALAALPVKSDVGITLVRHNVKSSIHLFWIIMVDLSHSRLGSKPWYVDWLWSNYQRNCTCQFNLNCLKWIPRILFEFQCILLFHRIPKVYCRRPENSKLALLVRTTSGTQSTRCAGRNIGPKMSLTH